MPKCFAAIYTMAKKYFGMFYFYVGKKKKRIRQFEKVPSAKVKLR